MVPDPGYTQFYSCVKLAGGVPVALPLLAHENFVPDLSAARKLLTDRTRALIVNSPHNPTGAVLTVMTAVQLVGNLSIPALLSKFPSRLLWTLVSLASGASGLILLIAGGAGTIWLSAVFLGIMLGGLFPIALLMPLDENKRTDDVNSWTAMIKSGGYIISSAMPFFIGFLYDRYGSHDITLLLLLGYIGILAVLAVILNKKQPARSLS